MFIFSYEKYKFSNFYVTHIKYEKDDIKYNIVIFMWDTMLNHISHEDIFAGVISCA